MLLDDPQVRECESMDWVHLAPGKVQLSISGFYGRKDILDLLSDSQLFKEVMQLDFHSVNLALNIR
jgi:hypothetical protein